VGASVGIGALIMGVSLLSIFASATTVIYNQVEVALEVSDPDVAEEPDFKISNLANSGSVQSLTLNSPGGLYYPGTLDFGSSCGVPPTGSYTVSSEEWQLGPFLAENSPTSGIYDGEWFSFQELDDEEGAVTNWYVWYNVDTDDADPGIAGTGIEVNIALGDDATSIRDATLTELNSQVALTEIIFSPGADVIEAAYQNSGPALNLAISDPSVPFPILSNGDGGVILAPTLLTPGSNCPSTPTITIIPSSPGGVGGEVVVNTMEWDYSFDLTNEGGNSVKLSEIYSTINGGSTEVLSSIPTFTVEYIFPGEKISIVLDANSADTVSRVAISSHGMNIAVEV
jgi:archaellum component FlaF (FlaF/FlaG flagellin family)